MTLVHHLLRHCAQSHPERVAVIAGDCRLTFGDIDRASDRLAAALQASGTGRGDRVAVMLDNSPELVVALWAVLKAGGVFVPITPTTSAAKLAFILADCGAGCVLATAAQRPRLNAVAVPVPVPMMEFDAQRLPTGGAPLTDPGLIDQDLCLLIYTSGSTGQPKGVMMSHRSALNNLTVISGYLGNHADDVVLCVLPMTYSYGLFQALAAVRTGYTLVVERSFAYPYEVLRLIGQYRVTGFAGVPTLYAAMLGLAPFNGLDLSSLRYLTNAAAPLPPAHILRLRQHLPAAAFFSMYGLTECTRVSFLDPARLEAKPGSVGRAIPNSEAYVVDEYGNRLPPGQIGELVVRGSGIMRGYWRRPDETARALRDGEHSGEKLLYTGDLFVADAEGDLTFVGRGDDVFKSRGEKVAPCEIERVLAELVEVTEAAVIGVPHPVDGMAVKAFVVAPEGSHLNEAVLRRHCQARLGPHLVPRFFELCASLPKTESGKVTKTVLRQENPRPLAGEGGG
jgi:amino acid adenylation domain-containing protein